MHQNLSQPLCWFGWQHWDSEWTEMNQDSAFPPVYPFVCERMSLAPRWQKVCMSSARTVKVFFLICVKYARLLHVLVACADCSECEWWGAVFITPQFGGCSCGPPLEGIQTLDRSTVNALRVFSFPELTEEALYLRADKNPDCHYTARLVISSKQVTEQVLTKT